MTPLALILATLLAKLRPAITQPYPTGPMRKADKTGHRTYQFVGRHSPPMSAKDMAMSHARRCLDHGLHRAAAFWLIAATSPNGEAHILPEEEV